ncbi:MAG TPA: hypothetical protein VFA14_06440 [Herbaspirillum sp.]|nr:hypothetical protein [Herbaspirillum sp.]
MISIVVNFPVFTFVSKLQARWQFDETPPLPAHYFSEEFDDYQLEGRVLPAAQQEAELPQLLAIHGARSDYTKLNAILYPLQTLGIASLSLTCLVTTRLRVLDWGTLR